MTGDKKKLIITPNKEMPDDFWNYLVNPIVGFYVGRFTDPKYSRQ
jgi:hypothetical protein